MCVGVCGLARGAHRSTLEGIAVQLRQICSGVVGLFHVWGQQVWMLLSCVVLLCGACCATCLSGLVLLRQGLSRALSI